MEAQLERIARTQKGQEPQGEGEVTLPSTAHIEAHQAVHGGLWKVVPALAGKKQPRPFFVLLCVHGKLVTYEQGDFVATVDESPWLRAAEWIPVDSRGNEVGTVEPCRLN
ncbi:MAG: hypothetical protein IPM54_25175 [Polyangiaceae bacterium]|nr:hypothetical protein [Polyangiaceae bacterium]